MKTMKIPRFPVPLQYCEIPIKYHKCQCYNIATHKVRIGEIINKTFYRCQEHIHTKVRGWGNKWIPICEHEEYNQSELLASINSYLRTLIGKNILSEKSKKEQLKVMYLKENTGGVMCFQEQSKKWKFVYYRQITKVFK